MQEEEEHQLLFSLITVQILLLMKRNNMSVQEISYGTLINLLLVGEDNVNLFNVGKNVITSIIPSFKEVNQANI